MMKLGLLIVARWIAGFFALIASLISAYQIRAHIVWNRNVVCNFIVRILFMVPVYAIESWIGLVFPSAASVFGVLRECYEAFAIYSFYQFLVNYLGGMQELADTLRSKPQSRHIFPFCCFPTWHMGAQFLKFTSAGILQYIPVKLSMSIITAVTTYFGVYGDSSSLKSVNFWATFMNNCSQVLAMYCLIMFYQGTKEELAPVNPLPKIISIKAIIFFTYWQQLGISALVSMKVLSAQSMHLCPGGVCWTADQLDEGLVDFIICVEMLGFAIAHHYCFPVKDFAVKGAGPTEDQPLLKFAEALNLSYVAHDVLTMNQMPRTRKQELDDEWTKELRGGADDH